ncbi:MAG: hypothetical protein CMK05_07765 [Ponticaulis sp.]|nr:hypothetical protein [Ponticaulis sp.]
MNSRRLKFHNGAGTGSIASFIPIPDESLTFLLGKECAKPLKVGLAVNIQFCRKPSELSAQFKCKHPDQMAGVFRDLAVRAAYCQPH